MPSGLERGIDYRLDDHGEPAPPVLAVKLQELFGLAETPRIADGRVPLLLHLLSPGGKPLQVTPTCTTSGTSTYAEVQEGNEGALPAPPVARRPVERGGHPPGETPRHITHPSRGSAILLA